MNINWIDEYEALVACEYSGIVRDALINEGMKAISCDLLPTERSGPHFQGDTLPLLKRRKPWKLIIAHPPCTYLCNSGVRWLYTEKGRFFKMLDAAYFFIKCLFANGDHIVVENPIMHKHAMEIIKVKYTQLIQPWQFGIGETKATCLWLRKLPILQPTKISSGRYQRIHLMSPSKDRSKLRSITYSNIAEAMAQQWAPLCK